MSVIASVQVRMGSERLPGKVLREVRGTPLLGHLLDRLALAETLDGLVVATTTQAADDAIAAFCAGRGTACVRGDEQDVLGRTVLALDTMAATVGVEVFGDCPLIDPAVVDAMVRRYVEADGAFDFVGNDLETTYPPGMEVEVFSVAALVDSHARATDPAVREHGTLFIRQHPELYRLLSVTAPPHHARPEVELEVDTLEDLEVIDAVLAHLGCNPRFTLDDILALLDTDPDIARRNQHIPRRWKAFRRGA